jgi:mono/diheme cytochrome c family protein
MSAGKSWRTVLATVAVIFVVVVVGGLGFIYSGVYDIAATAHHWPITNWVIATMRDRSIEAHAAGISVPPGFDDPAKVLMGADHFAAHCAICHGAPGVPRGDIAEGLYPQPPNLAKMDMDHSPAELFWVLKHGLKMTGMPAWSDHSDEELWATVAFLEKLPMMSEADYAKLVMTNAMHGGMHHMGGMREPHDDGH